MPASIKQTILDGLRFALERRGKTVAEVGFYSPLVDRRELARDAERVWPATVAACAGIDFDLARHRELIAAVAPLAEAFDYGSSARPDAELERFYDHNSQFASLDARLLFGLMRWWQPARIVEVGSGYSTLLMADVAERFLAAPPRITAIEPYPRPFLHRLAGEGRISLLPERVQDIGPRVFEQLQAGDILFVDSSHVAKTGSDVNTIVFDVIPRLRAGVHIHFHDIFLPRDYPPDWVLQDRRSWNEQYVVRALLMYASSTLQVTFGAAFALHALGELPAALGGAGAAGGSLWLTKLG